MTETKSPPLDCPILDPEHPIHQHCAEDPRSKGGRRGWAGEERRKLRSRFAPWVDVMKIALLIASVEFLFRLGVTLRKMHTEVEEQTQQLKRIGNGVENVHEHILKGKK